MPIYEYSCTNCNGRFQRLVSGFGNPSNLRCPRCGNERVQKAVSRFAVVQSEEARMEALADPSSLAGLDENDPASIARWAKKMGKEMGEEMEDDWEQMVDEMLEEEMNGQSDSDEGGGKAQDLGWG